MEGGGGCVVQIKQTLTLPHRNSVELQSSSVELGSPSIELGSPMKSCICVALMSHYTDRICAIVLFSS